MEILLKTIVLLFIVTIARTIRKIFLKKKPVTKIERKKIIFNNFFALIILLVILIGGFYYYRTNQINNGIKNRAHRKYYKSKIDYLIDSYENKNRVNKTKEKQNYNYETNEFLDETMHKNYSIRHNSNNSAYGRDKENQNESRASINNRSNQMNPNNSAYGSSRNSGGKNQGQSRASINNRSNQMNPNNPAYGSSRNSGGKNQGLSRASINNRSNQMNPNHSASKGKK